MELNLNQRLSQLNNSLNILTSKFSGYEEEIKSLKHSSKFQDDQLEIFRGYSENIKEVLNSTQLSHKIEIEQKLFKLR